MTRTLLLSVGWLGLSMSTAPLAGGEVGAHPLSAQEAGDAGVVSVDMRESAPCQMLAHGFALHLVPALEIPALCPATSGDRTNLLGGTGMETPPDPNGLRLTALIRSAHDLRGAGTGYYEDGAWVYPGPAPLHPGPSGVGLDAWGSVGWVAGRIRLTSGSGIITGGSHLSARLGPVRIWAGSRPVAMSWGRWGRSVLGASVAPEVFAVESVSPFAIPLLARLLGPMKFMAFLGPSPDSGPVTSPLFAGGRIQFVPFPWLVLGGNRAVLFGGEGNRETTSGRNLALALLGFTSQFGKSSVFENQVASLDALARTRLGGQPAMIYAEWAADVLGFAPLVTPGIRLGMEAVSTDARWWGGEVVYFGKGRVETKPWYQHRGLTQGWSRNGVLLGHPLGGHGFQLVTGVGQGGPAMEWEAWTGARRRGEENLFSPDREGWAFLNGGSLRGSLGDHLTARLRVEGEVGGTWKTACLEGDLSATW